MSIKNQKGKPCQMDLPKVELFKDVQPPICFCNFNKITFLTSLFVI